MIYDLYLNQLLSNLELAKNPILSCLFLYFVINEVQFLIPAVIVQMFNPIA